MSLELGFEFILNIQNHKKSASVLAKIDLSYESSLNC